MVEIHDHFDGSGHCLQCGGRCTLRNGNLMSTELVRWIMLSVAAGQPLVGMVKATLENHGVEVDAFLERAKQKLSDLNFKV